MNLNIEDYEKYDLIIFGKFYYSVTNNIEICDINSEFIEFHKFLNSNDEYLKVFKLAIQNYFLSEKENYWFYAKLLESLNEEVILSKYLLAKFYFQNEEYIKTIEILNKNKLVYNNDNYKILYLKSLFKLERYEECKLCLETSSKIILRSFTSEFENLKANINIKTQHIIDEQKLIYKLSLRSNIYYYKSFKDICNYYILEKNEIIEFLKDLKDRNNDDWIIILYLTNFEIQNGNFNNILNNIIQKNNCNLNFNSICLKNYNLFKNNILNLLFENKCIILLNYISYKLLFEYKFDEAEFFAKIVYKKDKYNQTAIFILMNIYKLNNENNKIMKISLDLSKYLPNNYITFYCIGILYDIYDKVQKSRNYFEKSIKQNPQFIHSYLELANSYSKKCETDNALNIYLSCLKKFPLCYLTHGFLGIEYGKSNDLNYAVLKLKKSLELNPNEPYFLNEWGYIFYKKGDYQLSLEHLLLAERNCQNSEFLLKDISNNLSHCYRKLEIFEKSINYIDAALNYENSSNNNFTKAFITHIVDNYSDSNKYYYKAISLDNTNPFLKEMYKNFWNDENDNLNLR